VVDYPPYIAPRLKKDYSYASTPSLGLRGLFYEELYLLDILADCKTILKIYAPSVEIIEACFKHSYLRIAPAHKVAGTRSINMNEHL
jgi:hypothetical protein